MQRVLLAALMQHPQTTLRVLSTSFMSLHRREANLTMLLSALSTAASRRRDHRLDPRRLPIFSGQLQKQAPSSTPRFWPLWWVWCLPRLDLSSQLKSLLYFGRWALWDRKLMLVGFHTAQLKPKLCTACWLCVCTAEVNTPSSVC